MRRSALVLTALCTAGVARAGVVIDEIDITPDAGRGQWVELVNDGPAAIDLGGWSLATGVGPGEGVVAHLPHGALLLPGERVVVGATPTADVFTGMLRLPEQAGVLRLVGPGGAVRDAVAWGDADAGPLRVIRGPAPQRGFALVREGDRLVRRSASPSWRMACTPNPGSIRINEFLPDPDGADGTVLKEWVELYNSSDAGVNLEGWVLQKATQGAAYGNEGTVPVGQTIAARGYYLIGETNVPGADFLVSGTMALGSGSDGDGVRLLDCNGAIVDTVVYGDAANGQAVVDDSNQAATSVAAKPGSDQSVARRANGVDTNQSGNDFWVPTSTTPRASNPTPPVCVQGSPGDIVINELVPNPAGSDTTALGEYVELFNPTLDTVSLEGWKIASSTSSTWSDKATLPASAQLGPGGFYVVGETNVGAANYRPAGPMALGSGSDGDGVRLVDCAGRVIDTVVYGPNNADAIVDDGGVAATSVAPSPGDGDAIARRVDGADTNRSGDDFALQSTQTPGAPNPRPPQCSPTNGDVVINEFLANPPGSDSDVLLEWVELYNGDDAALSLEGWTLSVATQGNSYSVKHTFASTASIEGQGHLLVGEANVPGANVLTSGVIGLGSGLRADGVRITDCRGTVVDTVVFGDATNEDALVDDSGSAATSVAPTPGDGVGLARRADGDDSNRSGDDFVATTSPTPGAANPVFECFPSNGDVVINEFLPDPGGSDGEALREWVELYNNGGDPVRVDGWTLVFANDGEDVAADVLMPPESAVPAGGFLVVGDANVPEADVVAPLAIGNGSGADAIRLLDCEGRLVDVVVYGDDNEDNLVDEDGNPATSAGSPGSDESLARAQDGADDNAAADWQEDRTPSPGASNSDTPDTDTETDSETGGGGGGCHRDAPDGGAPGGGCGSGPPSAERGCATAAVPLGLTELLLAGIIAVRRRRR
jgi:hypothetical protein